MVIGSAIKMIKELIAIPKHIEEDIELIGKHFNASIPTLTDHIMCKLLKVW